MSSPFEWDPQISSVFQSFHKLRLIITVYSHCIDWSRAFTIRLAVEEKKILKCKLSFRWSSHTLTTHWRDSKLKSPFLKRDNVQWRKPKGFATTTTFFWSARLKQPFLDLVTTKSVTSRCCQCPPSNASESTIDPFGVKFAWLSDLIIDIYIQASESSFNFHPERQFGWLQRGRGGFHDGNY